MNTIEEFFENRLSFNVKKKKKKKKKKILILEVVDCDEFKYFTKIHNPQSLRIKNNFDLIEKLKPLLNYISSNIKKIIKEDEEYCPECSFTITASVDFSDSDYINSECDEFRTRRIGLFECNDDEINV